jgi:hypothetical protein
MRILQKEQSMPDEELSSYSQGSGCLFTILKVFLTVGILLIFSLGLLAGVALAAMSTLLI